ncbi:alpha/beta hydrolase [Kurthia sibirica]|uniref:Carboxylesterase n=1 Tax=Kurthia sibirica TaxID=202750 RepID=A0A2U3AI02_9BACL|nr:carboxylesterase [Kurthia sibirica]PWI24186.1 carboxylesterase [Kurthia sibirica]GEK34806.1 carboxylesterase [Kurthia sibirica]
MRVSLPKPLFFEAGPRAVLLLHGFTGNSADVHMLGRFLQKHGYTSIAPHYKGHGVSPEKLIQTSPSDWWQDVIGAYQELLDKGYKEIAVAGLSLGGVFSLKLGYTMPVKGIVTMCAPMTMKTTEVMFEGVLKYAKDFARAFALTQEQQEKLLRTLQEKGMPSLPELPKLIMDVRSHVDEIYAPIFVVQARLDTVIDKSSAQFIYDTVESNEKNIKWYEQSGHVITLDKERIELQQDVLDFFEGLDWEE